MTPAQAPNSHESALEECDRLVKHFDERAKGHKKKFVRYKYSSVALTVGVTVISALQAIYQPAPFWAWVLPVSAAWLHSALPWSTLQMRRNYGCGPGL